MDDGGLRDFPHLVEVGGKDIITGTIKTRCFMRRISGLPNTKKHN